MARSNNDLQQVAVLNLTGREARYALIGLAFASGMLAAAYSLYPRHFAIQDVYKRQHGHQSGA